MTSVVVIPTYRTVNTFNTDLVQLNGQDNYKEVKETTESSVITSQSLRYGTLWRSITYYTYNDYDQNINGGGGNDTLVGAYTDDTLNGGADNDLIFGYEGLDYLIGGTGADILIGGADNDTIEGGDGYDTAKVSGNTNFTITDSTITGEGTDSISEIEAVEVVAGNSNNTLDGSSFTGDLILTGGQGNDVLKGSTGSTTAVFAGEYTDFVYTPSFDSSFTVRDNNSSDGNEGTDTLTDVDRLVFISDDVAGKRAVTHDLASDSYSVTINAVSGVGSSTYQVSSEDIGPTQYILGVEGTVGSILNFDSEKLADWINGISLPDQSIEDQRLTANLIMTGAGGVLGEIPFAGGVLSTYTAMAQERVNYEYDLAQVNAQIEAAEALVKADDTTDWGTIIEQDRELIFIDDFQVGVDTIILPTAEILYFVDGTLSYNGNTYSGTYIKTEEGNSSDDSAFAFIRDNENFSTTDDGYTFGELLQDLREENSYTLSTFNQNIITAEADGSNVVTQRGTYAGDVIQGSEYTGNIPNPNGRFSLVGLSGDDLIQGASEDDDLYGGFNTNNTNSVLTYENDGNDILQGNGGNDTLDGGSGNDILDGGTGTDSLIGGTGADTFAFISGDVSTDIIDDFSVTEGDSIQVDVQAYYDAFNDVSFDYTYSGTDLTLTFSGQDIATLVDIASADVASVFKQIELTGTSDTTATTASDIFLGDSANNNFSTSFGDDYLYGGDGNDTLNGGWNNDVVFGGDGNDRLIGRGNNDILIGGYGSDTFSFEYYATQSGTDRILDFTAAEGDKIEIDAAAFYEHFGAWEVSSDSSAFDGDTNSLTLSIFDQDIVTLEQIFTTTDAQQALQQIEYVGDLNGGASADILTGSSGNQVILGNGGDDTLNGGSGGDVLDGGSGKDLLIASDYSSSPSELDYLAGGQDADIFRIKLESYNVGNDIRVDNAIITDFNAAEGDILQFDTHQSSMNHSWVYQFNSSTGEIMSGRNSIVTLSGVTDFNINTIQFV
ncbi:MAG: hypothetical protein QNJ37_23550 [Crocosphaera sp.]|nr:hypothetical protein [Crocosphaera sp.]